MWVIHTVFLLVFLVLHSLALDKIITYIPSIVFLSLWIPFLIAQVSLFTYVSIRFDGYHKSSTNASPDERRNPSSISPIICGIGFCLGLVIFDALLILYHTGEVSAGAPLFALSSSLFCLAIASPHFSHQNVRSFQIISDSHSATTMAVSFHAPPLLRCLSVCSRRQVGRMDHCILWRGVYSIVDYLRMHSDVHIHTVQER